MTEEKIEQVDEFTEELSDEALDREGAAAYGLSASGGVPCAAPNR